MNVQWLTKFAPNFNFAAGVIEPVFPTNTQGWTWEEAGWAGVQLMKLGHSLQITRQLTAGLRVTVFGLETFAAEFFADPDARQHLAKVGVRCVCGPGDGTGAEWRDLARSLSQVDGLSTIGEREAVELRLWAERNGYRGTPIDVTPLGAVVYSRPAPRKGFAYLGSLVREKRVPLLIEAARRAEVRLTLALAYCNSDTAADLATVVAQQSDLISVTQPVGIHSRKLLLASVRGAVTFSRADSQWLPGTEARACGGIAIAGDVSSIRAANDDGILYVPDGDVDAMAVVLKKMDEDDGAYAAERTRQQLLFPRYGRDSISVGTRLANWVCSMGAT